MAAHLPQLCFEAKTFSPYYEFPTSPNMDAVRRDTVAHYVQ